MIEAEIIEFVQNLPDVVALTASEAGEAPAVAWGDTFFFYDPNDDSPPDRRFPFATIVTKDYGAFDSLSNLNRAGVVRVNISVSRSTFERLLGYPPADHTEHRDECDYAAFDRILPHPIYAAQAWVSILNPGDATSAMLRALLTEAHQRAAKRRPSRR